MQPLHHCLLLILMVSGVLGIPVAWPQASDREVAFINVNVLPMDAERILHGHTVLVRGDRIIQVGPVAEVTVPAQALRVDGAGKYLMPGLAEMHAHIPSHQESQAFTEAVLFLYVANGVTTARGMLGAPNQFELREKAQRGEIVSPTLYLAGPSFSGRSIQSPEEAIQQVQQQKHEGWDLLKIHPGLTRAAYDAMATTAQQVGMRFVGHVPAEVGLLHALEMGRKPLTIWMGTSSICRPMMARWMRRNWRMRCAAPPRPAPGLCRRWPCGRFCSGPMTWRRSSVMQKSNTCHRNRSSIGRPHTTPA